MPVIKPVPIPTKPRLLEILNYLVNALAESHKGKVRLSGLIAFGALQILDIVEQGVANLQNAFIELVELQREQMAHDRLIIGGRASSFGTWYIARFAHRDVLLPVEEEEYLDSVLSEVPKGASGLCCRHYQYLIRAIDYNFVLTPGLTLGLAAAARRQAEMCEFARFQDASDRAVARLNVKRKIRGEPPITTIGVIQEKERKRKGLQTLVEELGQIPDLEKRLADLASILPAQDVTDEKTQPQSVKEILEDFQFTPEAQDETPTVSKLVSFDPSSGWARVLRPSCKEPQLFFLPEVVSQALLYRKLRPTAAPQLVKPTLTPKADPGARIKPDGAVESVQPVTKRPPASRPVTKPQISPTAPPKVHTKPVPSTRSHFDLRSPSSPTPKTENERNISRTPKPTDPAAVIAEGSLRQSQASAVVPSVPAKASATNKSAGLSHGSKSPDAGTHTPTEPPPQNGRPQSDAEMVFTTPQEAESAQANPETSEPGNQLVFLERVPGPRSASSEDRAKNTDSTKSVTPTTPAQQANPPPPVREERKRKRRNVDVDGYRDGSPGDSGIHQAADLQNGVAQAQPNLLIGAPETDTAPSEELNGPAQQAMEPEIETPQTSPPTQGLAR